MNDTEPTLVLSAEALERVVIAFRLHCDGSPDSFDLRILAHLEENLERELQSAMFA